MGKSCNLCNWICSPVLRLRKGLNLVLCDNCDLLQIEDPLSVEQLYEEQPYLTGHAQGAHLDDLIGTTRALERETGERVLEIGCNEGVFLEALQKWGYTEIIGVEPNLVAAVAARKKGFYVFGQYFNRELVETLQGRKFDAVFARHVVEHVSKLEELGKCIRQVVENKGLLIIEVPEVTEGLKTGNPYFLWEQHVNYFDKEMLRRLFWKWGFEIIAERSYVFGGESIAFIGRKV